MSYFAHESAYVDAGARIGEGTQIWHFCHVSSGAEIGKHCTLGQNVFVADRTKIGDGVKIQNNVSIYSGVILEDDVFCGPSMVFTNVRAPRAAFPRRPPEGYATTRVCRGASIGANSTIVCGVTIGRWALIGAGAVVTRDVPDFALMQGVPARPSGWACECGETLKLAATRGSCAVCGRCYAFDGAGRRVSRINDSGRT